MGMSSRPEEGVHCGHVREVKLREHRPVDAEALAELERHRGMTEAAIERLKAGEQHKRAPWGDRGDAPRATPTIAAREHSGLSPPSAVGSAFARRRS